MSASLRGLSRWWSSLLCCLTALWGLLFETGGGGQDTGKGGAEPWNTQLFPVPVHSQRGIFIFWGKRVQGVRRRRQQLGFGNLSLQLFPDLPCCWRHEWRFVSYSWHCRLPVALLLGTLIEVWDAFIFLLVGGWGVDNFSPTGVGLWRTTTFSLKMCTSSARSSASKCCSAAFFCCCHFAVFLVGFPIVPLWCSWRSGTCAPARAAWSVPARAHNKRGNICVGTNGESTVIRSERKQILILLLCPT